MHIFLDKLLNIVYPSENICHLCMSEVEFDKFLGLECRDNLEFVNGIIDNLKNLDAVYYSLFYNRFIKEKIREFKFHNKTYLYKVFGNILYETYRIHNLNVDLVAYIPSNRDKFYKRGYNQGELMANYLSKMIDRPVLRENLIKIRTTKNQSDLDRIERKKNLSGAFHIKRPDEIKNKKILLVDDIITTGSTLSCCSEVLVNNKAKSVIGLGLASTKVY